MLTASQDDLPYLSQTFVLTVAATEPSARRLVFQRWEESYQALKEQLPQATLEKWKAATQEACAAAYAPYRQGTIYPQMVAGCNDRLNRVLLEERKSLGE